MRNYNLKRNQIHHLRGRITDKKEIAHYAGRMKHQSQYELKVDISQNTKPAVFDGTIQAMRENVLDDNTWDDIRTDAWQGKRYIFRCIRHGHIYKLVGWKDISTKATKAMVENAKKAREAKVNKVVGLETEIERLKGIVETLRGHKKENLEREYNETQRAIETLSELKAESKRSAAINQRFKLMILGKEKKLGSLKELEQTIKELKEAREAFKDKHGFYPEQLEK